jgi:hypothetical protein
MPNISLKLIDSIDETYQRVLPSPVYASTTVRAHFTTKAVHGSVKKRTSSIVQHPLAAARQPLNRAPTSRVL